MGNDVIGSYNALVGLINARMIAFVVLIPFEIYVTVILYKLHKLLYGKGTLLQILGIYREFIVSRIVFGKTISIIYPIAWILSLWVSGMPASIFDAMATGDLIGFLIFVETICMILHILYGVAIIVTGAKYNRAKREKKYRNKMAKDLQNVFWWSENIRATSKSKVNTSTKSSKKKRDSDDDYDDGL